MKTQDSTTTLDELKENVRRFCEERRWDPYHGPHQLAIGLITEAAELLEIFRFVPEKQLHEVLQSSREEIADELADSLYFILRFSQLYGFDLSQAMAAKMRKNALKYPAPTNDHEPRASGETPGRSSPE
ncbi:MAG: nucleotide pyrophosphohydrolase [Bdellovibrionales bacterium]